MNHLIGNQFGGDWYVWDIHTGVVQAIFSTPLNTHGWSAAEAHAKSFVMRASDFNPFELDSIP